MADFSPPQQCGSAELNIFARPIIFSRHRLHHLQFFLPAIAACRCLCRIAATISAELVAFLSVWTKFMPFGYLRAKLHPALWKRSPVLA
jgi:hypothetical protein